MHKSMQCAIFFKQNLPSKLCQMSSRPWHINAKAFDSIGKAFSFSLFLLFFHLLFFLFFLLVNLFKFLF